MDQVEEVLISIRRIIRVAELHGRKIRETTDLKISQLMVLQALDGEEKLTVSQIAAAIRMSQASVTLITAKLETLGLVERHRGTEDRRKVYVLLSDAGRDVLDAAPDALHEKFAKAFEDIAPWERSMLVSAFQRVAEMLNAEDIDAAPILEFDPEEPVPVIDRSLDKRSL